MSLPRKTALLAVLLVLALCISASASVVASWTSHLIGTGDINDITCNATVTKGVDSVYTYAYELVYTTGSAAVHTYKIQNPNAASFYNATNTSSDTAGHFTDPAAGSDGWVYWTGGFINVGDTRTFSYQSVYAPMTDIQAWGVVIDGGTAATGKTLAMGASTPEPSSLAALLLGAVGLVPVMIKRRK